MAYGPHVPRPRRRYCRRRWAHAPTIHVASHADHKKQELHGFLSDSISMHKCGSLPTVTVLRLEALRATGAPL